VKYLILLIVLFLLASCDNKANSFFQVEKLPSYKPLVQQKLVNIAKKYSVIDSLKTNRQAEKFIQTIDANFKYFELRPLSKLDKPIDSIFKKLIAEYTPDKNFYTADFDNNGYTDMLFFGGWPGSSTETDDVVYFYNSYIVMNYDKNQAKVLPFTDHLNGFPVIKERNNKVLINNHIIVKDRKNATYKDSVGVLSWAFIGLCNYNPAPKNYNIEKIEFSSGPCFGHCPMYQITVNKDRSAIFLADQNNFPNEIALCLDKSAYTTTVDKKSYEDLVCYINYMDFLALNRSYSVFYTDAPRASLIITYDNGKVKQISDYGLSGTYGLRTLYRYMGELRFNQKWEKTTEPKGARLNNY